MKGLVNNDETETANRSDVFQMLIVCVLSESR